MPEHDTGQRTGQALVVYLQVHRSTARNLRLLFKDGASYRGGRSAVARRLNCMARAAGIDPTTFQARERWRLYLRAARALRRTGKLDDSADARKVQIAAANSIWWIQQGHEREQESKQQEQSQPAPPVTTNTITLSETWEAAALAPFGLAPGDKLELELITDMPRAGETIAFKEKVENHSVAFGNFVEFRDSEDDVESVWVIDEKGYEHGYERAIYNLWRIKSVTRTILYAAVESATSARERKLKQLRDRFDKLNKDDDITTCSARFKLEKQIYDLERESDRDDWPEYIDA